MVLQLAAALRAAGHFTVAALTAPFGFEGPARAEAAGALAGALHASAHLVAVTEQEVLMQVGLGVCVFLVFSSLGCAQQEAPTVVCSVSVGEDGGQGRAPF